MNDRHHFGARVMNDGVAFSIWAPDAKAVDLVCDGYHQMMSEAGGWYSLHSAQARVGSHYKFLIDGDTEVPDPASHFQPSDVSGPSEVVNHSAYAWETSGWIGRPWEEAVFLEAHVGAFTEGGTFLDMIGKLDHIAATGFTALELMPLADFAGGRNWGYDGVLWYAPDDTYGRPEDLKRLIDEAHKRGLMMFLDVVYNHFGPEGNYLPRYASRFFCSTKTPWGDAIDYMLPEVRAFVVQNALHWFDTYRFDGLRLDAIHALAQPGAALLLRELSEAVGDLARRTGRHLHLVVENDDNQASLLDPDQDPLQGKYRAQWNDDYHHAWHVLLTGEQAGYYSDYPKPQENLVRALTSGFVYQGEASGHRDGTLRGEQSGSLPPSAFVNFLQNHDQIGNRPLGDRLEANATTRAIQASLAVTLIAPMPPLMFMGEEWGTISPFPFFCNFHGDLAKAIREGRRREFHAAYEKYADNIPDPLDERTFTSARLNWAELTSGSPKERHNLVRNLLAVRHAEVIPRLRGSKFQRRTTTLVGPLAQWIMADERTLTLYANLSDARVAIDAGPARRIWGRDADACAPWSVIWTLD